MNRRSLLQLLATPLLAAREFRCDIAVIGGSLGGCAAALAALRNGMSVILTEETDWIGGQVTSQAVPPDEHPWIEMFGATQLYRRVSKPRPRVLQGKLSADRARPEQGTPEPGRRNGLAPHARTTRVARRTRSSARSLRQQRQTSSTT